MVTGRSKALARGLAEHYAEVRSGALVAGGELSAYQQPVLNEPMHRVGAQRTPRPGALLLEHRACTTGAPVLSSIAASLQRKAHPLAWMQVESPCDEMDLKGPSHAESRGWGLEGGRIDASFAQFKAASSSDKLILPFNTGAFPCGFYAWSAVTPQTGALARACLFDALPNAE